MKVYYLPAFFFLLILESVYCGCGTIDKLALRLAKCSHYSDTAKAAKYARWMIEVFDRQDEYFLEFIHLFFLNKIKSPDKYEHPYRQPYIDPLYREPSHLYEDKKASREKYPIESEYKDDAASSYKSVSHEEFIEDPSSVEFREQVHVEDPKIIEEAEFHISEETEENYFREHEDMRVNEDFHERIEISDPKHYDPIIIDKKMSKEYYSGESFESTSTPPSTIITTTITATTPKPTVTT